MSKLILFGLLFIISTSVFAIYLRPPEAVKISDIKPTQTSVGRDTVELLAGFAISDYAKPENDFGAGCEGIIPFLKSKIKTIRGVYAPDKMVYLTDGHHRTSTVLSVIETIRTKGISKNGCILEKDPDFFKDELLKVEWDGDDLPYTDSEEENWKIFGEAMLAKNKVYFDRGAREELTKSMCQVDEKDRYKHIFQNLLPQSMEELGNAPMRSTIGTVFWEMGIEGEWFSNYLEFHVWDMLPEEVLLKAGTEKDAVYKKRLETEIFSNPEIVKKMRCSLKVDDQQEFCNPEALAEIAGVEGESSIEHQKIDGNFQRCEMLDRITSKVKQIEHEISSKRGSPSPNIPDTSLIVRGKSCGPNDSFSSKKIDVSCEADSQLAQSVDDQAPNRMDDIVIATCNATGVCLQNLSSESLELSSQTIDILSGLKTSYSRQLASTDSSLGDLYQNFTSIERECRGELSQALGGKFHVGGNYDVKQFSPIKVSYFEKDEKGRDKEESEIRNLLEEVSAKMTITKIKTDQTGQLVATGSLLVTKNQSQGGITILNKDRKCRHLMCEGEYTKVKIPLTGLESEDFGDHIGENTNSADCVEVSQLQSEKSGPASYDDSHRNPASISD